MPAIQQACSLGDLARRWRVQPWKIRRIFECGDLPEPPRVGRYRVFQQEDLPAILRALQQRGYVREGFSDV